MADSKKIFSGLLNGIVRLDYYNDTSISDALLKEELYPDMPDEQFTAFLHKLRGLIKSMATTDMELAQAEAFLAAQKRKHTATTTGDSTTTSLTEEQVAALLKFWSAHRSRVHSSLVDACMWSARLKELSWRVDVKSRSRYSSPASTSSSDQAHSESAPCTIVQMRLENKEQNQYNKNPEGIQFELDETGMKKVLDSLNDIQSVIAKHSQLSEPSSSSISNGTVH